MGGKEGWAECNVHARMKCQQPVVNMTVTKKQDGDETAIPQSLVPDFETSMGIMTAVSAMWSQMNEPGVGPAWSSIHFRFKDGSMSHTRHSTYGRAAKWPHEVSHVDHHYRARIGV
jgi:hypothetical protein